MNYTNLPLIILFSIAVIYSFFMSIMTFTKSNMTFLDNRYVTQINKDDRGNYHSTLMATTIGSYVGAFILLILLIERLVTKDEEGHVVKFKWEILAMFIFGILVLLSLTILLVYFSTHENVFGTSGSANITYNYPFFNTLAYLIIFIVLGALYVHNIFKLSSQKTIVSNL